MDRKRGLGYVPLLLGSLLLLAVDHRGAMLGDRLFRTVGLPPWSEPGTNEGMHISAVTGIVLWIVGARLTIHYFRREYRRVGRKVLLLMSKENKVLD